MTLAAGQLAQLAPPLASALTQLAADPAVSSLSITSGWRSAASQIALRTAHCGNTQYDIYQKPSSQCSPPTAIPGQSNHEVTLDGQPWALAADLAGDLTHAHQVMGSYNLHTPVTGEPWHFELLNTAQLRALAQSGATAVDATTINVPGVGNVTHTATLDAATTAGVPAGFGLRIASFAGGLACLILAGIILLGGHKKPAPKLTGGNTDQGDDPTDDDDTDPSQIPSGVHDGSVTGDDSDAPTVDAPTPPDPDIGADTATQAAGL